MTFTEPNPERVIFQYCIYDHPADYPDKFVVRQLMIVGGIIKFGICTTADTLEAVRMLVPYGKVCLCRNDEDPPCVVETWI